VSWGPTAVAIACQVVASLLTGPEARAATPPPLEVPHAAVASDHASASAAGVELLRAGGNAADAACAVALALGVVNPHASGIGGGGFAVIYTAKDKKVQTLDFREVAPGSIRPELFVRDGKPIPELSLRGGLAVGVPGEVRGLSELVRRFGKRSWKDCVAPAERLATRGFPASRRLAVLVAGPRTPTGDPRPPEEMAFVRKAMSFKEPMRPGDLVRRPELGATLRLLRQKGPEAFYSGALTAEIVKAVKEAGGVMLDTDLRRYAVVMRPPLEIGYRGFRVFSMPPPSSGGIVIAEVLGILAEKVKDPAKLGRGSSAHLHLLTEAFKHGFADRARLLGDPDFVEVPTAKLLDPAYHRALAARIDEGRVLPQEKYGMGGGPQLPKDGGTAHLSVIDAEGNAIALTTTVNTWFGAHLLAGKTGIVLNNQMDDFATAPNTPNAFGLVGNAQNAVAAGKRPLSSMSPTVVLEGDKVKMVVGGAGGPSIITGTLQVLMNVLDFKLDAQAASAAPRIHHQWQPPTLSYEEDIPADVIEALGKRGHQTRMRPTLGGSQVNVVVRTATGLEAASEFRGGGGPAGY
jgi:gamma-glutamyltranspeptidase / glutathione hydrolase